MSLAAAAQRSQPALEHTTRQVAAVANGWLHWVDELAKGGSDRHRPSGLADLDKLGPIIHDGHLIVVAGRPAMGKTALALGIAEAVAGGKRSALFFSVEMSAFELVQRVIAKGSGVPIPRLQQPRTLTRDDWRRITDCALGEVTKLSLLLNDSARTMNEIVDVSRRAVADLESRGSPTLGLILVDYLQLIQGPGNSQNRTIEVGRVSRELKRLAMELAVPVIAVAQLNRALEARPNKRPMLADLRDSGEIEQNADAVLFLYRDEVYNETSREKGIAELIVAKNRHGPSGSAIRLAWHPERCTFADLA